MKESGNSELHQAAMSVDETSRFLGVGRTTMFKEIKGGRLKARKLGSRTLILREDAENYLRALPVVSKEK